MKVALLIFLMFSSLAFAVGENSSSQDEAAMCEEAQKTGCDPCVQKHCYGSNNDESNLKNAPKSKNDKSKGSSKGNQG